MTKQEGGVGLSGGNTPIYDTELQAGALDPVFIGANVPVGIKYHDHRGFAREPGEEGGLL